MICFRSLRLVLTCLIALLLNTAATPVQADPLARAERTLLLMAGQGLKAGDVEPLLGQLCAKAAGGALGERYSDVLKVGVDVNLADVLKGMAPGKTKETSQDLASVVVTALKNQSLVNCTGRPLALEQIQARPFDALVISVLRDEISTINLKVNLVESDWSIDHTRTTVDEDALRFAPSSVSERGPFVGCLAWTVWSVRNWLAPEADCAGRWGLRARPGDLKPWAFKAFIGSLVAAGAAVTFWAISDNRYNAYVKECSNQACLPSTVESRRSTVKAWDAAWVSSAAIAAGLGATSSVLYLVSRRRMEAQQSPVRLTLGPDGSVGVTAVGRW